jgi:L-lactate dehydrogenase complex protein LldF
MGAQAGISGVNFAVAETGGVVVCTNEGNADLGTSLPPLHIACVGIEKLVPRLEDLGVFTRLLARSATGQPITGYTSHFHGPPPGGQLHIVLVDNGRSELLADEQHRRSLHCIRCGACINTCPVYRRSGGYSYHATIPGPIGSTLGPSRDAKGHYDLPYACSLCGSCTDVCPAKIDLHEQLLVWRHQIVARRLLPWRKRALMKMLSMTFRNTWMFVLAGKLARWTVPWMPRFLIYNPLNAWGREREIPQIPRQSFREMYKKRYGK